MSKMTIESAWHNPRNPKCRSCTWYKSRDPLHCASSGVCISKDSKAYKYREHNNKACSQFRLRQSFEKTKDSCVMNGQCLENMCQMQYPDIPVDCCEEACPANIEPPPPPKEYYLENAQRDRVGNCLQFWKIGNRGYTCNIDEARVFTQEELDKEDLIREDKKYRKWPRKYIDDRTVKHVDHQMIDLHKQVMEDYDA